MWHRPLPFGWKVGTISLLVPFLLATNICAAQMDLPPPSASSDTLQDHPASDHHSRHHSLLMGPCLDRGQFCDKLKRFCNDFKYQTLVNKECRATCGRC